MVLVAEKGSSDGQRNGRRRDASVRRPAALGLHLSRGVTENEPLAAAAAAAAAPCLEVSGGV